MKFSRPPLYWLPDRVPVARHDRRVYRGRGGGPVADRSARGVAVAPVVGEDREGIGDDRRRDRGYAVVVALYINRVWRGHGKARRLSVYLVLGQGRAVHETDRAVRARRRDVEYARVISRRGGHEGVLRRGVGGQGAHVYIEGVHRRPLPVVIDRAGLDHGVLVVCGVAAGVDDEGAASLIARVSAAPVEVVARCVVAHAVYDLEARLLVHAPRPGADDVVGVARGHGDVQGRNALVLRLHPAVPGTGIVIFDPVRDAVVVGVRHAVVVHRGIIRAVERR